jgi:hypothetical protein
MATISYEKVKLMVGVPTAGRITVHCARGLMLLMDELRRNMMYEETKEQIGLVNFKQSSVISGSRENTAEEALNMNCTHLLFVDDDMMFQPDAVGILASRREPIIGVNYRMRYPPARFTAQSIANEGQAVETTEDSTGVEDIDYIGFGLCLIETRVFRAIPQPWFLPQYLNQKHTTEDLPFFRKAREYGWRTVVDHDASKRIGHVGECIYTWDKNYA